jgi:AAA ATPase domain
MDQVRNPYSPGAGTRPPTLVGREPQLDQVDIAVQRLTIGRPERSLILTGLRGVGKTVLLNEFGKLAVSHGWVHEHIEATEDIDLARVLGIASRTALLKLSTTERVRDRARRGLGVLRSFLKVRYTAPGGDLSIDVEPFPGLADSGDLDRDLGGLFTELGECAQLHGNGVLFTIDELQYIRTEQFAALIVGLHRVSQAGLPFLVIGAGLPSLPGLAGEAKSYAERLFSFVQIGSLTSEQAQQALDEPARAEGVRWQAEAIRAVEVLTGGYPYFLQEFGKQAWAVADGTRIELKDVELSAPIALSELDGGFFRARVDRTTDSEREYLRAMANVGGPGPYRSGDVANSIGKAAQKVGSIREALIRKGLCYSPRRGEIAFTVPLFDDYVRRSL